MKHTSLTVACWTIVLALKAKSRVDLVWTCSVWVTVDMIVVLEEFIISKYLGAAGKFNEGKSNNKTLKVIFSNGRKCDSFSSSFNYLAFPPRLFLRILVNLESLKLMCCWLCPSLSFEITWMKKNESVFHYCLYLQIAIVENFLRSACQNSCLIGVKHA